MKHLIDKAWANYETLSAGEDAVLPKMTREEFDASLASWTEDERRKYVNMLLGPDMQLMADVARGEAVELQKMYASGIEIGYLDSDIDTSPLEGRE